MWQLLNRRDSGDTEEGVINFLRDKKSLKVGVFTVRQEFCR